MKNATKVRNNYSYNNPKSIRTNRSESKGTFRTPPPYGIPWMEQKFGQDFSGVSIHPNSTKATEIDAQAFTHGNDIHFAPGKYQPQTHAGKELLAHELTHVVQQREGKVKPNDQFKKNSGNSDTRLEKEADQQGRRLDQNRNLSFDMNASSDIPSYFSTIQRKKTEDDKPTEFEELTDFNADPLLTDEKNPPLIIEENNEEEVKIGAVWTNLNKAYEVMKEKGDGYWNAHLQSVKRYQDSEQKEGLISELHQKQQMLDTKFQKHYVTSKPKWYDDKYQINSKGNEQEKKEGETNSAEKWNYSNKVNLKSGLITASINYANEDSARIADAKKAAIETRKLSFAEKMGLPNSEILFQQYREVAKFHHKTENNEDESVVQSLKNINQITRAKISNLTTLKVAYIADENQSPMYFNPERTWAPESPEFKALLGTPNVRSAVFLLNDHMDILGKTIESIKTDFYNLDNHIEIKYKPIPK